MVRSTASLIATVALMSVVGCSRITQGEGGRMVNGVASQENGSSTSTFIPDEQLYPHNLVGPTNFTAEERTKVNQRIARCYDPQPDADYSRVDFQDALDKYMNAQVKQGLRKVSRAIIYDMPHVWGDHFYTKYFPHHWISAIVPDILAESSHCLDFDYEGGNVETTDDPNGCLFFRKSFQPTQKLTNCIIQTFEDSESWKGSKALMSARGPLFKALVMFQLVDGNGSSVRDFEDSIELRHSSWNANADIIPGLRHIEENEYGSFMFHRASACKTGTLIRQLEDGSLECELRGPGNDKSISELLLNHEVVLAGQMCHTNGTGSLSGRVALVEDESCADEEKVANAAQLGAVAVLYRARHTHFNGKSAAKPGGALPIPAFSLSEYGSFSNIAEHLDTMENGELHLRISSYTPKLPKNADMVPNWGEEVEIYNADENAGSVSIRERAYELIRQVSMEIIDTTSTARARYAIASAARVSMSQPLKSKYDQFDAATEEALLTCYGLGTTTTTMDIETFAKDYVADPIARASKPTSELEESAPDFDTCKRLKVISAGSRIEYGFTKADQDRAEFFLNGQQIDFEAVDGINLVAIDPVTEEVYMMRSYGRVHRSYFQSPELPAEHGHAIRMELGALKPGSIVAIAVKGGGMYNLDDNIKETLAAIGARQAGKGRKEEGYILVVQLAEEGAEPKLLFEKIGRWIHAAVLIPCAKDVSGLVPREAAVIHEASKCMPAMWDKAEVGGPPYPQVSEASGSFPQDNLRVLDTIPLHPICGRMSLAMNAFEMADAPYPNADEWEPGEHFKLSTAYEAAKRGNPKWVGDHLFEYCMDPDVAVCTSFTVCWALMSRHFTKLVHPYCDSKKRAFPEMPIMDDDEDDHE